MEMMKHTAAQAIDRQARLVVTPHPLTLQGQTSAVVMMADGESLASVLHTASVDADWVVELDGLQVPALMWGRTRVKHGVVIECRRVVHGGGSNPLRTIAYVALAYYTMGAGNAWLVGAGSLTAATGFTAALIGATAFYAGAQVLNRIMPPAQAAMMNPASNNASPTYSLSGGRNSARLWEPMSLVLGQPYCVPDLAGQPWTYFSGENQYLTQIFHAGINVQRVDNVRIGQTSIDMYQDISGRSQGLPESPWPAGLPANSVDTISGALLDAPGGTGAWVYRTTSVGTIKIGIDLEMTLFGVNSSNGAYESRTVALDVQYCPHGSNAWVGLPTGMGYQTQYISGQDGNGDDVYSWQTTPYPDGTAKYTNATSKPLRSSILLGVASGQYDIRLRKTTANETTTSAQNVVTWTQLKSFQPDLTTYPGQALVAFTIKASGQLTGNLDQLNWVATARPAPYWNGGAWVTATSKLSGLSNPGVQLLQLARGIYDENGRLIAGLGWADSRIDIASLQSFMVWCATKQFTFDAIIQQAMSIGDLMDAIAYAGMGSISWASGKFGVQWLADNQPIEGVINMGNIKAKSFSVSYVQSNLADEIEYGYFDSGADNQWNSLRVLSPVVTIPSNTARLSNLGITSERQAATLARYAMAQNVYMGKAITLEQDIEFLTCKRGTVLALSHDMTQWGYSGRVQSVTNISGTVTLALDDLIPAPTSGAAYIGLRLIGETQYRIFTVVAFSGSTRSVTLSGTWPSGVALPGSNGQPMDALWIYDFKATPGQKVVVSKIEPGENQSGAKVTLTPLPDTFWPYVLTGAYTPPPNRSLLNLIPNCTAATMSEVLKRQGNTFYTELSVNFDLSAAASITQIWGSTGGAALQLLGNTLGRSFTWMGGLSETWNIEVRPFSDVTMGTKCRVGYTVKGLQEPPPDVTQFSIAGDLLSWIGVSAVDLAGYRIRFNYGQNTWWNTATALHDGLITQSPYQMATRPSGTVTLLIKAVDTSGNESLNPAVITLNLGDQLVSNILLSWPQDTTWPGIKTNGTVSAGKLVANSADFLYGRDDAPFYGADTAAFYDPSMSGAMSYQFSVIPINIGTLTLLSNITATGYLIEYLRDSTDRFYEADSDFFYGLGADPFYGDAGIWAVWPGSMDITASENINFRVTTNGGLGQDTINSLSAILDVPDINVPVNNAAIASAGTRLALGQSVHVVKNVQITVQSDGNGGVTARIVDKSPTLGPLIQVLNASGAAVPGVIDAYIQAY